MGEIIIYKPIFYVLLTSYLCNIITTADYWRHRFCGGIGTRSQRDAVSPQLNNKQRTMEQEILTRLEAIEFYSLLAAKNVLTLDDVAMLTGLSKSHLYKLTCAHQIPYYKPNGKTIYFDRGEVEAWMKQNRVSTTQEAEAQAAAYAVAGRYGRTRRNSGETLCIR